MTRTPSVEELRRPCASCGGEVAPDGYCLRCGTRAVPERDHFTERPAPWVAGVCDRGPVKAANEDAVALWASPRPGGRAALVVLDGVSDADDSAEATLLAARAARDALQDATATPAALFEAAAAAQAAVAAAAAPGATNPPAATFAAALFEGGRVVHAGIGDSRVYWLPDVGEPVQLTTDDSLAEALVRGGTPRADAEASPQAHALTRWLGQDSDDPVPRVGSIEVTGPGWLLACTDGLWNYASSPEALRALVAATDGAAAEDAAAEDAAAEDAAAEDAAGAADALWRFACAAGGHDNITVALARLGAIGDNDSEDGGDEERREATDG